MRRLHRLQRQHEARQQLAQRARASAQEDAIGWDDDLAPADLAPAAAPGPTHDPAPDPKPADLAPAAAPGPAHDAAPDPSPPAPGAGAVDPGEQDGVEPDLESSAERGEGSSEGVGESAGGAADGSAGAASADSAAEVGTHWCSLA